jgi:hypothetical protein
MDVKEYLLSRQDRLELLRIDEVLAINEITPPDAKIFMLWENRGLYLDREYFPDISYSASYNKQLISRLGDPDQFYKWLKQNDFDYIYNARLWPWDSDKYLQPETREEFNKAELIYREFVKKYGEIVLKDQGELVKIK